VVIGSRARETRKKGENGRARASVPHFRSRRRRRRRTLSASAPREIEERERRSTDQQRVHGAAATAAILVSYRFSF